MRAIAGILFTGLTLLVGAGAAQAAVELRAAGLDPEFRSGVSDYTLPGEVCAERFDFEVAAPGNGEARIGDGEWFAGTDDRRLRLRPGQAVKVTTRHGGERERYFARCLPDDFPAYEFERSATPAAKLYVVTPFSFTEAEPNYVVIFDRRGTPVWWHAGDAGSIDAKVLSDGSIAWARMALFGQSGVETAYEIHEPDGSLTQTVRAVGLGTDHHELEETEDGNYLVLSYVERGERVNATAYNGDRRARVVDGAVQKVSPRGELLWEWRSADHIGLEETGRWWSRLSEPYDLVHANSVEETANGDYLLSFRHADAVYRLDGETGAIEWKLGGTPRPESLEIAGDPYGGAPFGGQHDARELDDGTITLHDNGTDLERPPRAVRYAVSGGVATMVEQHVDPAVSESGCCGSARYSQGTWLASWGGTGVVSEFSDGERTFSFDSGEDWSYRAVPVEGETDRKTLRKGMNEQVPLKG